MKDQSMIAPQKIIQNCGLLVALSIEQKMMGTGYLRRITSVSSIFINRYPET